MQLDLWDAARSWVVDDQRAAWNPSLRGCSELGPDPASGVSGRSSAPWWLVRLATRSQLAINGRNLVIDGADRTAPEGGDFVRACAVEPEDREPRVPQG